MRKVAALSAFFAVTTPGYSWATNDKNENGFIEDSHLNILNRDFYFSQDFRNGSSATNPHTGARQSRRAEWAHAVIGRFESGFTQGPVGFGVDAYGQFGVKLDGGDGVVGNGVGGPGLIPRKGDNNGEPKDEWGKAGGAVKVRAFDTVVKYGDVSPTSPVLHAGDIRLLPQTLTGLIFDNTSIAGLKIEGGRLTASSDRSGVNHSGDLGTVYGGRLTGADDVQYIGADYRFNDNWSFKLHTSRLDNVWNQSFARVDFKQRLTPTITWDTGLNYYRTRDSGEALLGKIDNDSWSTHLGLNVGFNRFLLAYEQVRGDSPFDYVWNTYDLELDNASQWSDFNNPNERSWQASYTYDFAGLGLPGLSLTGRYLRGDNIDGTRATGGYTAFNSVSDGKHWERDFWASYIVQSGPAKDLRLQVLQATHRVGGDFGNYDSNVDELRVIVEYPLDLRML
ncbi:OprD family porin [Pseudomonas sp. TNT11]|uniref:OprD family porin n=1 Tax=Pseudomonas emilianonis TaxID=2915812 RepID=A0ABT0EI56_9PSED|nr:OprD family porin [Pseudomonas emilianonis]MCK1785408.1 OprD family porin [Pseudomonas emilianonis]